MELYHISAFSVDGQGGNPAGVCILDAFLDDAIMQEMAAQIGYSETAFLHPLGDRHWRVRYFAPADEVPFCGHATIATGCVLAERFGQGDFKLSLNDGDISVVAQGTAEGYAARLISPPTHSEPLSEKRIDEILMFLGWDREALHPDHHPALAATTEAHPVLFLKSRELLAEMDYDFEPAQDIMRKNGDCTVMLVYPESATQFHVRNIFASGGVVEDPATGSAAAAFAGLLRDRNWPHGGRIEISQGVDMGQPCQIFVEIGSEVGAPVRVSGQAYKMEA